MKIGIVVPLKAKSVSKNWVLVEENLSQTLASIEGQTSNSFQCLVVGHDLPDVLKNQMFHRSEFLKFELRSPPVVDQISNNEEKLLQFEKDKFCKVLFGIETMAKRDNQITHWFVLDADDLIRNDFVEKLVSDEGYDSYIINKGYIYYKDAKKINITNDFSAFCASSSLIATHLIGMPEKVTDSNFIDSIYWKVSHVNLGAYLKSISNLREVTQRLTMYVRDNGENVSRTENMPFSKKVVRTLKLYVKSIWFAGHVKTLFSLK